MHRVDTSNRFGTDGMGATMQKAWQTWGKPIAEANRRLLIIGLSCLTATLLSSKEAFSHPQNGGNIVPPSTLSPVKPMPIAPQTDNRPRIASSDTSNGSPVPQVSSQDAQTQSAPSQPATPSAAPAQPPVIPSLDAENNVPQSTPPRNLGNFQIPQHAGQQWMEYDIRPFIKNVKNIEKPQQWIVDWIIRETGTDVWFNEPMGVLSVDSEKLRVFHTPEMQRRVAAIYEKFVNGVNEPQIFGLRIITINNPNWRSRAFPLMRSVPSQSSGVSAWLMPKENGAILLSQLRARNDARELQALDIPLYNGQLQYLEQVRSRNYLKEYLVNTAAPYPPYLPKSDAISEGFKLQISPLMGLDGKTSDLMLKCEIDQVERLNNVKVDLPINGNQIQSVQIEVPQIVSWRLQERFQWPTDQVLLLSCGVVANPVGEVNNTLLNNPPNFLGLNKVIPTVGQRNDAILWIEYKGTASNYLGAAPTTTNVAAPTPTPNNAAAVNPLTRGRY